MKFSKILLAFAIGLFVIVSLNAVFAGTGILSYAAGGYNVSFNNLTVNNVTVNTSNAANFTINISNNEASIRNYTITIITNSTTATGYINHSLTSMQVILGNSSDTANNSRILYININTTNLLAQRVTFYINLNLTSNTSINLSSSQDIIMNVTFLDDISPVLYHVSPANNTYFNASNLALTCNITDETGISNVSIYISSNSTQAFTNTTALTGTYNSTSTWGVGNWSVFLIEQRYNWTCRGRDTNNNANVTFHSNWTFIFDNTPPAVNISWPVAKTNVSVRLISFNYTATDSNSTVNYTNISVYNSTGYLVNSTTNTSNGVLVNMTIGVPYDDVFSIRATAYDKAGNANITNNYNVTVDTASPSVVVYSPVNNSTYYSNVSIVINFNMSDLLPNNLWYDIGNGTNYSFTAMTKINFTSNGIYNVTFYANDSLGRVNNKTYKLTVVSQPSNSTFSSSSKAIEVNVSNNYTQVFFTYNTSLENMSIALDQGTTNSVVLNLSGIINKEGLAFSNTTLYNVNNRNFTFIRAAATNFTVTLQTNTTLFAPMGWGGDFLLPTANSSASVISLKGDVVKIVDIGSPSYGINLSKPARIKFDGQTAKRVGWILGGNTLTDIATICNNGTEGVPSNINSSDTRECFLTNATDLIVWTYHFSTYAVYTPAAVVTSTSAGSSSGGSSSSSSGGACTETWACSEWSTCLGGSQTRTCTDSMACGTTASKPSVTQSCLGETKETTTGEQTGGEQQEVIPTKTSSNWTVIAIIAAVIVLAIIIISSLMKKKDASSSKKRK